MNSMKFARRAIAYERQRQIDLIEAGGTVVQSTLNFDPVTGRTSPLRSKEDAHDYRYFPEPDLPPVVLSEEKIEAIRQTMPPLPTALRERFQSVHGLNAYDTEQLTEDLATAQYFDALVTAGAVPKAAANLLINKLKPYWQSSGMPPADTPVPHAAWVSFLDLIAQNKISNSAAYQQLWDLLLQSPDTPPLALAQKHDLLQSDDGDALRELAESVIAAYPDKVTAYQKGKKGLIGFFMGELMKRSKGRAAPAEAKRVLGELLK